MGGGDEGQACAWGCDGWQSSVRRNAMQCNAMLRTEREGEDWVHADEALKGVRGFYFENGRN